MLMESVKKRVLWLVLLLLPLAAQSSHIVGGEFELIHLHGNTYRLNLVIYFDVVNGLVGAKDLSVTANIYRKSDNGFVRSVFLPRIKESLVNYTQQECARDELVTNRILYSDSTLVLSPSQFGNASGYYISWERCCRNYTITNVISLDPGIFPTSYAGQTFYLEFPAIVKDGEPFVDSTPRLFPPLSDYACINKPYYTNFGGVDDDDDSLVYSLVTPLSTKAGVALPSPSGLPYPNVNWRAGFGINNIMHGSPDLRISTDGMLTVTPTLMGLFVFAVKVEEYRDGIRIGETRRDFQMLVIDCEPSVPPAIIGKVQGSTNYQSGNLVASFSNLITDANRCVIVRISDGDSEVFHPDPTKPDTTENVRLKVVALNFKEDLTPLLPTISSATLNNGSTVEFTVCFPQCPFLYGPTPQIGIIAMDDACSLPLMDTLRVFLQVQPPPNGPPQITSANPVTHNINLNDENQVVQHTWPWSAVDPDGDPLVVSVLTDGFSLPNAGMTLSELNNNPGAADGELTWDPFCEIYDFTQRTAFQVTVRVEDQDHCQQPSPANSVFNLSVTLPLNAVPTIDSDLTSNPSERTLTLTRRLLQTLNFTVTGKDLVDNDKLVLTAYGGAVDPTVAPVSIATTPVTGTGTAAVPASWNIDCSAVDLTGKEKEDFIFQFIVVDKDNKCRIYKADTLDVNLTVLPPLNQAPVLSVANVNHDQTTLSSDVISLTRGGTIDLRFTGTDGDATPAKDNLKLQLADQEGNVLPPQQYTFVPVEGTSPVQTNFTWTPDCSIFPNGILQQEYTLTFELLDDRCQTAKKDSLRLTIRVNDVDGSDVGFIPPNFVSPNGDNHNDYYAMERLVGETGELENILPLDNCESRFEYVHIHNRWGKEVFRSTERDFRWFPDDSSAGVYYYTVKFTKKEYRGSLTVRY